MSFDYVSDADLSARKVTRATASDADLFLAVHPVGSYYKSTDPEPPDALFGGTWKQASAASPYEWTRTA